MSRRTSLTLWAWERYVKLDTVHSKLRRGASCRGRTAVVLDIFACLESRCNRWLLPTARMLHDFYATKTIKEPNIPRICDEAVNSVLSKTQSDTHMNGRQSGARPVSHGLEPGLKHSIDSSFKDIATCPQVLAEGGPAMHQERFPVGPDRGSAHPACTLHKASLGPEIAAVMEACTPDGWAKEPY